MIKFEFYFCFIYFDISLLPLNYKNVMEFTTVQMNWFRRPSKVRFKKKENNVLGLVRSQSPKLIFPKS